MVGSDGNSEPLVKAYVGDLEVVGNGIVQVTKDKNLLLVLGSILKMEFKFESDKENNEFSINRHIGKNKRLIWTLTNFNNALGTGIINPIELGSLSKRKVFVGFFVWSPVPKSGNRIVNYTIYLGDKSEKEDKDE